MFYLTNSTTGEWIGIFKNVEIVDEGVWAWCGLFRDATATPLSVGMEVKFYDTRGDDFVMVKGEVVKVNRVTFKAVTPDGETHTVRVDR